MKKTVVLFIILTLSLGGLTPLYAQKEAPSTHIAKQEWMNFLEQDWMDTFFSQGMWFLYEIAFKRAKYVDLTHSFSPTISVWPGFGTAKFKPAVAGSDMPGYVNEGEAFTYDDHGFIATAYELPTDQYGTQLDPPAHWDEYGATISDLPATYAIRPLVVIDIHKKVQRNPGYHCNVNDIKAWEEKHGKIPEGSVVMIRSDWYKKWSNPRRFNQKPFPGIELEALKFLHLKRRILFHGHEPLDTDTTPDLEGEYWLMHNHYTQAEGVANLDQVPEAGALISIGFAKPEGGTGGYARYIAICPLNWKYGTSVVETPGAPLPMQPYPLRRDENGVLKPFEP
jgi:kynurenine formamidase